MAGLALAGLVLLRRDYEKVHAALRSIAPSYSGTIDRPLASFPQLAIRAGGTRIEIGAYRGEAGPFTCASFLPPSFAEPLAFRVVSGARPLAGLDPAFRYLKPASLTRPELQAVLEARAADAASFARVLDAGLASGLARLVRLGPIEVRLAGTGPGAGVAGRCDLIVERLLTAPEDYACLADAALELVAAIEAAASAS